MTIELSRDPSQRGAGGFVWICSSIRGTRLPTAAAQVLVAIGLAFHNDVFAAGSVAVAFFASWFIQSGGVFTDNLVLIAKPKNVPEHSELLGALREGSLNITFF